MKKLNLIKLASHLTFIGSIIIIVFSILKIVFNENNFLFIVGVPTFFLGLCLALIDMIYDYGSAIILWFKNRNNYENGKKNV